MAETSSEPIPNEPATYLIVRGKKASEKAAFKDLLTKTKTLLAIAEYPITRYETKSGLNYRYFDTFDAKLAELGIFTYLAPTHNEGVKIPELRGCEYVLNVDFPPSRVKSAETYQLPIPSGTDLFQLRPDDFRFWPAISRARQAGRNMPLQEMLRLEVEANTFVLQQEGEDRVLISLDNIAATGPFNVARRFYEMVVKPLTGGPDEVQVIASYFRQHYRASLRICQHPRWRNAIQLIKQGRIEAAEIVDKDREA